MYSLIETNHEKDVNALETVRSLFGTKTKDFITAVDEKNIILVKEVRRGRRLRGAGQDCREHGLDMLNTEAMTKTYMWHTVLLSMRSRKFPRSYKEAKMALDVGKIFYAGEECNRIQHTWVSAV